MNFLKKVDLRERIDVSTLVPKWRELRGFCGRVKCIVCEKERVCSCEKPKALKFGVCSGCEGLKVEALKVALKKDSLNVGLINVETAKGERLTFSSFEEFREKGQGLVLKGLDLEDARGLILLPENLTVLEGGINLSYSDVRGLPRGLKCEGLLDLYGTPITRLPSDLKLGSTLNLQASHIKELPPNLTVPNNLILKDCPDIKALPLGLKVGGDLRASWSSLERIPPDLEVTYNLFLNDCQRLKPLPEGLKKRCGQIDIYNSSLSPPRTKDDPRFHAPRRKRPLQRKPVMSFLKKVEALKVALKKDAGNVGIIRVETPDGPREFRGWADFAEKGKGLTVTGLECPHRAHILLPENLTVDETLDLADTPITSLPRGLKVNGDLDLNYCERLTTLPPDLKVQENLSLRSCHALTSLPPKLRVSGELNLNNCRNLRRLPLGLKVGGGLDLSSTRIKDLPLDMEVDGRLRIYNCWLLEVPKGMTFEEFWAELNRRVGQVLGAEESGLAPQLRDFFKAGKSS